MLDLASQTRDSLEFRPGNQVKKPYEKRIEKAKWDQHESIIRQLHSSQTTRERIVKVLRTQHGFNVTTAQLDRKMKFWGLRAYIARPSNHVRSDTESLKEVPSLCSVPPKHDEEDKEVPISMHDLQTTESTRFPDYVQFKNGHSGFDIPLVGDPLWSPSENSVESYGEEFDDYLDIIPVVYPISAAYELRPGMRFNLENRKGYLVDVQVARVDFMNLWTGLKSCHLPISAISMADFLCASRMFQEAFELYILALDYLLASQISPTELVPRTIIDCLRTATTAPQQNYAIVIANQALMNLKAPRSLSDWFSVSLKLYKATLNGKHQPFVYKYTAAFLIRDQSGRWISDCNTRISQRERIAFGIRICRSIIYGTTSQLIGTAGLSKVWDAVDLTHLDLHDDYLKEKNGENLLRRCGAIFRDNIDMLNQALPKCFSSDCPEGEQREFFADVLYCFMIQLLPCTELKNSPRIKYARDSAQFTFFEAVATLASLIAARMTVSATPKAEDVLQSVEELLQDPWSFNETFMQAYWSKMIESASNMDAVYPSKGEKSTQYLLGFASTLHDRSITNIDMFHPDKDIAGSSLESDPDLAAATSQTVNQDCPISPNDPIIYQRGSDTSSLISRRSSQFWRTSVLSAISKRSKASSNAMSLESHDSWRLNYYLQISDEASSRDSGAMILDRDSGINQIPEHPTAPPPPPPPPPSPL